jgi:hypothetical protein
MGNASGYDQRKQGMRHGRLPTVDIRTNGSHLPVKLSLSVWQFYSYVGRGQSGGHVTSIAVLQNDMLTRYLSIGRGNFLSRA